MRTKTVDRLIKTMPENIKTFVDTHVEQVISESKSEKIVAINVADLKNPETGKTYREENNEKTHNIPLGTLVEVDFDDRFCESPKKGLRLFVVSHDRDYDGTPLYSLSFEKNWKPDMFGKEFKEFAWRAIDTGYSEDSLKVVSY